MDTNDNAESLIVAARGPLYVASEYTAQCISMRVNNALNSADPVDLGAQSDLIGAPKLVGTEAVLAAQIGGVALASWMSPLTGGMWLLAARRAIRALRRSAHRVLLNAAGTAARIGRPGSGRDGDRGPDHHGDGGGEGKPIA
jgi:hypothetical protein